MKHSGKKFRILLAAFAVFFYSAGVKADESEQNIEKIVDIFQQEIDKIDSGKRHFVAIRSFIDRQSKKPSARGDKISERIFTIIRDRYLGKRNIVILNWRSETLLEIEAADRGEDTIYKQGVWQKKFLENFGNGFLITGTTETMGESVEVCAELVEVISGKVMAELKENLVRGPDDIVQAQKTPPAAPMTVAAAPSVNQKRPSNIKTGSAPPPEAMLAKGSLFVAAEPKEVQVKIKDGAELFSQGMLLEAGKYQVEISADGYEKQTQLVSIDAGKDRRLTIHLKPKDELKDLQYKVMEGSNFRYEGYVKDGKKHGQGSLLFKSGDAYVGQWHNDKKQGKGTYTYADGEKYIGQWHNNKMHGEGAYYFQSGNKFVGHWQNDKKEGRGTYFFKNGDQWEGTYKNDKKHGRGKYTWAGGKSQEEVWQSGKLVK